MGRYTGTTEGGFYVDETWQSNDGIVNEVSAMAPYGDNYITYTEGDDYNPGIWTVMPTITGDHMYFQGGITKRKNIKPFYLDMADRISHLNEEEW